MRVLFWSSTFWPKIGGVEVLAAKLLPALRDRGHEFMVITARMSTDQDYEDDFKGAPIYRFDFGNPAVFSDINRLRATRARIVELKRRFRPELVHINALDVGAFFHLITAREHPAPMLVTLHGLPVQALIGSQAFFSLLPGHRVPYLVKMLPDVVADGGVVVAHAIVSLTGRVYAMSDSVADAWIASGAIAEDDRVLAVFNQWFFEAARVTVAGR